MPRWRLPTGSAYEAAASANTLARADAWNPATVVKHNEHMQTLLASPEMKAQLAENSLEAAGGSVSDFAKFVQKESDYYTKFVKDFNITPQ